MTMYTLPNFCRVCLKYDKNLIDLAHIENEPNETLMSKLQQCVSEVEWTVFKPLLCHPCIKRLNIAHSFKKQCIHSAGVLKNYVELVKESQKKTESQNTIKAENVLASTGGTYMLLPNQKYVKILVGGQNQGANTFQNVFLNLIPASTLNPIITTASNTTKTKDNNQNVFLNINNAIQKIVPVSQSPAEVLKKSPELQKPSVNVNQLLTESKSEELSVEIDPTVFGLEEGDNDSTEEELNDYDEVISQAKINLKDIKAANGEKLQNGKEDQKYYVPILPKTQDDFFSSGQHFLFSQTENSGAFVCEQCQKSFATKKLLKAHINQFHLGKLPFKCEYCYLEFATRNEYELCLKTHRSEAETLDKSLTLRDFSTNASSLNEQLTELEANIEPTENGEYICDVCKRPFSSSTGLLRHKVRKHNQKNKKKYFIKGMKNAKCDICNREFSTQSYMQLHKKLHMRDDFGYKYKVFGKSKYNVVTEEKKSEDVNTNLQETFNTDDSNVENLDVTPDIFMDKSDDESNDEDREDSIEDSGEMKPEKMEVQEENASDNETEDEELNENNTESETINENNCDVKEVNDN
ncbi:unnamed protein product [Phyllotreta striolata]|uniref:Uncharacterized protein n=1 Tax=Phyllotreta striolata TaxID=444603 RepID=A0A9N9TF39_PHYSR|nr:unnamed protein product [Phyllotreta striolata]